MTMALSGPRPRPQTRFANIYAGVWALLALLALVYMVALAVNPSLIGSWIPERSDHETNEGQRSAARFATDISGLKQSVGDIQREMTSLRTTVIASATRDKALSERVTVLEERAKPIVTAEVAPPAAPKTLAQRQAEARALKAAERAAAVAPPAAVGASAAISTAPTAPTDTSPPTAEALASRFVVLNAPNSPIATGSILPPPAQGVPAPPAATQAAVSFGPGTIKAAPAAATGPVGVEIANGPSLDALRLNWSLLAERHSSQLKNLEARYTSAGEGQPYQLLAGPITNQDEAKRVCAQLQAKRVACRVTGFGGNAL